MLIADPVERDVKLKLLVRMKNRLARIAAGTAGFSDLSRGDWRQQGCSKLMVDGTKYTCIQDALRYGDGVGGLGRATGAS